MHNICCDNCHSHVAYALNDMEISAYGIRNWDMIKLCFLLFFRGRFLSVGGFISQFLPFSIFIFVIILVKTIWEGDKGWHIDHMQQTNVKTSICHVIIWIYDTFKVSDDQVPDKIIGRCMVTVVSSQGKHGQYLLYIL